MTIKGWEAKDLAERAESGVGKVWRTQHRRSRGACAGRDSGRVAQ
jgi:hypothetical protein